jgi:hypothetical protein
MGVRHGFYVGALRRSYRGLHDVIGSPSQLAIGMDRQTDTTHADPHRLDTIF